MKVKLINILMCIAISINCFSQDIIGLSEMGGTVIKSIDSSNETITIGSQYFNESFIDSKVNGIEGIVGMRYNAYVDEMEFINNDILYYLKKEIYSEVTFHGLNKKYIYTTYKDNHKDIFNGFLVVINNSSNINLYKKEKIILIPAKKASSGYDTSSPAKYKQQDPVYFIELNNEIIEVPKNEKKFAKLFGDKEKQIYDYIKSNKISLSNEQSLLKLISYLSKN